MRRVSSSLWIGLVAATCLTAAARADVLRDEALALFTPLPTTVSTVDGNRVTPEKVRLGKALYFDPRLSAAGVDSCNSCHNLATGGDDNLETAIGHGWQTRARNAPTVFNAVLNEAQVWDGRAEDMKARVEQRVRGGADISNSPENLVATLRSMPAYVDWFKAAFPGEADPVTSDNFARALEAFQATLITPAPFDAFLNGDDAALTDLEKVGLELFIDRGCANCHGGVNVGGRSYHPFGLVEMPGADVLPEFDKSRFAFSKTADETYVFRGVPLRNVAVTAPYFHSGRVWSLKQAVEIMGTAQLGEQLNGKDVEAITAFLQSLTGRMPEVTYPVLPAETADTPRPIRELMR